MPHVAHWLSTNTLLVISAIIQPASTEVVYDREHVLQQLHVTQVSISVIYVLILSASCVTPTQEVVRLDSVICPDIHRKVQESVPVQQELLEQILLYYVWHAILTALLVQPEGW